jgi:hypothetical protein
LPCYRQLDAAIDQIQTGGHRRASSSAFND